MFADQVDAWFMFVTIALFTSNIKVKKNEVLRHKGTEDQVFTDQIKKAMGRAHPMALKFTCHFLLPDNNKSQSMVKQRTPYF